MAGRLCDVAGLRAAHYSDSDTGVTVIVAPESATGAVDVRGGGPGTRETDLLAPHNTVEAVHAVCLSGGSAFGLAAADGVMAYLEERSLGFPVLGEDSAGPRVPIVPAAVIFDLLVGSAQARPRPLDGWIAAHRALSGTELLSGTVGAGTAAAAGRLKGGFGQSSTRVGQYVVAAGIVANPVGDVVDKHGRLYGDPDAPAVDSEVYATLRGPASKLNTTIGVVATDAPLTKAQATRLALAGHDGIARAVRPAHSPLDGDTLFALATGPRTGVDVEQLTRLSAAAADVVAAAIVDAVTSAESTHGMRAYRDILR
ncbi:P1 family peptidase [Corynebacterium sp. TAE3-ERU2]|uniref:P1 family peptidase n=1 Tax=Corynebacterium sp. TAE3-ERU2 TaxID=2849497 RepID=UPI00351CDE1B